MDSIRLKPNLIKCTINIKSCFNQRYILPITQVFNLSQLRIQTRLISMLPSSIFSRLRASHSGFKYCKRMMIFEQKSFIGLFGSLLDYFFFFYQAGISEPQSHQKLPHITCVTVLSSFQHYSACYFVLSFYSSSFTLFFSTFFVLSFYMLLTYSSPKDKIKIKSFFKKNA